MIMYRPFSRCNVGRSKCDSSLKKKKKIIVQDILKIAVYLSYSQFILEFKPVLRFLPIKLYLRRNEKIIDIIFVCYYS